MKNIKTKFRAGGLSLFSALICIIIGLFVGFICLVVLSWLALNKSGNPYSFGDVIRTAYEFGFKRIMLSGFYKFSLGGPKAMTSFGLIITNATPLIMTGLSVAFAFKTGLFNIGAAGQYTLGAFGALLCALVFNLPWWVCLLAATFMGAFWGFFPGFFKAMFNVNEVITSIMFNWIGLYAVNTAIYQNGTGAMFNAQTTKTWTLASKSAGSTIPNLGLADVFKNKSTTIAIFIAILIAIVIYIVINKTTFGYELKACGYNKSAAKYAGINDKKNIILSMVIAGALAGCGAGLYYLSGAAEWNPQASTALPSQGFDGISVALLASSNPIGSVFSATFISYLTEGGSLMELSYFPREIAQIITGIIIYLCAFSLLFKTWFGTLLSKKDKNKTNANAEPIADANVAEQTTVTPGLVTDGGKEDEK